jgi:hypothetical protein
MYYRRLHALGVMLACACAGAVSAQTTTLQFSARADNTLYQDPNGLLSNGMGQYLFAGQTATGAIRRALIAFDTSAIPPGSRVTDVQLRLFSLQSSAAGPTTAKLHRVEAAWGEAGSIAGGSEGGGGAAQPGDATWTHAVLPSAPWVNLGGDFEATPSSSTTMPLTGAFTFDKTVELIADVQDWLDGRRVNNGWLVKTDELGTSTARRINSRNNTQVGAVLPLLTVSFVAPGAVQSFGVGCTTSGGMPFTQTITGLAIQGDTAYLTLQSNVPLGLYITCMSYDVLPEPIEAAPGCFFWLRQIPFPNFGLRFHDQTGISTEAFAIPFSPQLFGLPLALQSILVDFAHVRQYALSNAHLVVIG